MRIREASSIKALSNVQGMCPEVRPPLRVDQLVRGSVQLQILPRVPVSTRSPLHIRNCRRVFHHG